MSQLILSRLHFKLLIVIILGALLFCWNSGCQKETVKRPNIILITIDTLRADYLGCYGYIMKTSPNIDRFAQDGMLFENCLSHAPDTRLSFASMLTGFLPHETKVTVDRRLPDQVESLPEILKVQGYKTIAVISNYVLRKGQGFEQGFMVYDDTMKQRESVRKQPEKVAEFTTDRTIELLKQFHKDQFFIWIHYQDPHGPYTPPGNFGKMFGRPGQTPLNLKMNTINSGIGGIPLYQQLGPHRDLNYYISQYAGEIRYQDDNFKRLIQALKAFDLYDDSLIILSADHGEGMGEHNYWFAHGEYLYSDQTHVPLIIKYGKDFVGRRKDFVQHIDILTTILKTLGIRVDNRFRGRDLFKEHGNHREIYAEMKSTYIRASKKISIVLDSYKLIFTPMNKEYELYNLKADPYEEQNLVNIAEYQQRLTDLKTRLQRIDREDFLNISVAEKPSTLTDEELEKLKSLGYTR